MSGLERACASQLEFPMGLDVRQKLAMLSDDSKYDLSCSCGTDESTRRKRQLDGTWLYPVPLVAGS